MTHPPSSTRSVRVVHDIGMSKSHNRLFDGASQMAMQWWCRSISVTDACKSVQEAWFVKAKYGNPTAYSMRLLMFAQGK